MNQQTVQRFRDCYAVGPHAECWKWTGPTRKDGRAMFTADSGMTTAARFAWEFYIAPIPEGLHVLHHCDNPACVNPSHLFTGTRSDNMRDMVAKDRYTKIKPRGEDHGNTKLTDRDFEEIRQLRGYLSTLEISKAYGISRGYVSHIQLGRYQR